MWTTSRIRFVWLVVLAVLTLALVLSNCAKEKPTQPVDDVRSAKLSKMSTGTKYYIYTAGALDTLLDTELSPTPVDYDTICFAADTLVLDEKSYTISNLSLYLVGDAPGGKALLTRDATTQTGELFFIRNTDGNYGTSDVEINNIQFEATGSAGLTFIRIYQLN